jgi:hexosaminidase
VEYYTEEDYQEIIDYAQEHYITVVPEIDVPGHTNAATASYGELRCDGEPTDFYTGASVGFSAVCTTKEFTYELLDDVIRELAEMTPGPYIHIGGDEADETSQEEYNQFISRVLDTVLSYDKTPMGWQQSPATDGILAADPPDETVIQYYADPRDEPTVIEAIQDGGHDIVLSSHSLAYPDYEYNENTDMGLPFQAVRRSKTPTAGTPGPT